MKSQTLTHATTKLTKRKPNSDKHRDRNLLQTTLENGKATFYQEGSSPTLARVAARRCALTEFQTRSHVLSSFASFLFFCEKRRSSHWWTIHPCGRDAPERPDKKMRLSSVTLHFETYRWPRLLSRSPGNFLDGWCRSPKLLDGGTEVGAWNLGPGSTALVRGASKMHK